MDTPSTFESIQGETVFAGTHVSGGYLNVTINGSRQNLPQQPEPFSTVPFLPDPDFVERPDITTWLQDELNLPGRRAALIGLGGVGKSQLAIQYAYQIRQQSPSTYVFWVHGGTRALFEEAYRSIADRLQLPGRHDPKNDILRLVYEWLFDETNGQWLMILDNADDIDVFYPRRHDQITTVPSTQRLLASLLPQSSNGRILVTSRSRDVAERLTGSSRTVKPMQPMDEAQARQLLKKKLRDKYAEEVATHLVHALEYIPLAITQAAAYILRRAPRMSSSLYLEEFRRSEKKRTSLLNRPICDLRRYADAANSVVTTWQITFEQIRKERPSATDLLSFMSIFNPQGIPEWVLRNEGSEDDSDELDDDLETLRDYSLVAVTTQKDAYEMHALVQLCTRAWLSSVNEIERWRHGFLHIMSKEYPSGNYENWPKCQQLEPHIAQVIETEPVAAEAIKDWARLLTNAGWYGWQIGRYDTAIAMLRKAVDVQERVLSSEHSDMLLSIALVALVLRHQGRYEEAEQMHRRALDGYEKAMGKDHPYTLPSVGNLASVLRHQGRYEEAEQMHRRALDGYEKAMGKDHPDTLTGVANLASVLQDQGRYEEAEQMHRRALDGYEKVLGKDHPYTLTSVSHLASVLRHQGRYEETEPMHQRALDGREKVLGKDHPYTLTSVGNLASVLQHQGRYEEAEQMHRRALDGYEKAMGKDHPYTLRSVANLASVLQHQGRYEVAEQMHRRALGGYEKALGKDHPDTFTSVSHLASVLQDQGRYEEAEQMHRRALDGYEKALGKDHPYTLMGVANLASVLHHQGRYEEAEQMHRRALDGREKALGKDHPDTLTSVSHLASVLQDQGRYEETEPMYRRELDSHVL
ncbi:hypothetical protein BGZ60DRAFT_456926 [Tricladium varicosporioides]|nr:hypothetical protein BGZ60DRAFT_456926 [Hymenoscyphus varicosporioides]